MQETATPSPILCVLRRTRAALLVCAAADRAGPRTLAGGRFPLASEWREKRDQQLEAKDKVSKEKNAAIQKEAKDALEKFNQEYKAKKDAQIKKNRYDRWGCDRARDNAALREGAR